MTKRIVQLFVASHNTRTLSSDPYIDAYIEITKSITADIRICKTRNTKALIAQWKSREKVFLGRSFAEPNHLHVMNMIFQKEQCQQWTWKSPDGVILNQIDYVMTDTRRIFNDVVTIGEQIIFTGSGHHMLRSKLCIDNVYED
ncbi:hypothetical protein KIL84_016457 [Mauremys mutica]|uniref:Uncharacterized protein n=1 Tax=Mauremys mutica TaxID=74926 RepID=A0A9D4AVV5_9SAUR|nr:hypothetical protein KIL84_016457 [Mauremys mutica]